MNKVFTVLLILILLSATFLQGEAKFRRLPVKEYRDKMKGGWVGQMVGVAWGYPIEFRYYGRPVPESMVPNWESDMVNDAFSQDDLYLDIGYLHSIKNHGLEISSRQAGIDFASYDFEYARGGRASFMSGIAPPDRGHPKFRKHPDGLGYQIAADFSGLIAPGLPNTPISLGEELGAIGHYGDGIYAGQFVGAMYSEAFFAHDAVEIVQSALKAIPEGSRFAEMVSDVLTWYQQYPNDWDKTYRMINEKYFRNKTYNWLDWSWKGLESLNMDVKLNGAFILTGLLYGEGDMDKTVIYSMRGGHDSDCNPSNSAGVLFTTLGYSNLPDLFTSIDESRIFSMEDDPLLFQYTLSDVVDLTEQIARQVIVKSGGRIEKDGDGEEVFVIPIQNPKPGGLQHSWKPDSISNSRYSTEELSVIRGTGSSALKEFKKRATGWKVIPESSLGFLNQVNGKRDVFVTYPPDKTSSVILTRKAEIPEGYQTSLRLIVGHDPNGGYGLIVRANGKELFNWDVIKEPWIEVEVDLSEFAGKKVELELENISRAYWDYEWAYWGKIELVSRGRFGKGGTVRFRYKKDTVKPMR